MPRCLPYSLVSRVLAALLATAAALKLKGLAVDPVGHLGLFSAPAFQVGIIELETFLAVWLLWGRKPLGSWTTAFGVFTIFAGVSAYQGWIGQASCGCFGSLSVSPWYAFGIDLAVLFGLIVGRPELMTIRQQPRLLLTNCLPVLYGVMGAAMVLVCLAGLASWLYGSADAALAHFRGERISFYPRMVDLGTGAPGEAHEATMEIVNRTDHSIRLIGGTAD